MKKTLRIVSLLLAVLLLAAACGDDDTASSEGAGSITVYSGRDADATQLLIDFIPDSNGCALKVLTGIHLQEENREGLRAKRSQMYESCSRYLKPS